MSLLKRDWWKILCFLALWFVLQLVSRKFNPMNGVLLAVCFLFLEGLLPYIAKNVKLLSFKNPIIWFLILEMVWLFVARLSSPLWVFHVLVALDATFFFLLIMAVFGRRRYTPQLLIENWGKWLIVVAVFYAAQMYGFPFVWGKVYGTSFAFVSELLNPLLYVIVTYSLAACKK